LPLANLRRARKMERRPSNSLLLVFSYDNPAREMRRGEGEGRGKREPKGNREDCGFLQRKKGGGGEGRRGYFFCLLVTGDEPVEEGNRRKRDGDNVLQEERQARDQRTSFMFEKKEGKGCHWPPRERKRRGTLHYAKNKKGREGKGKRRPGQPAFMLKGKKK